MSADTVPILSSAVSMAALLFGIYTYNHKASNDEMDKLKARVRDLETELRFAHSERTRLEQANIKLMSELLDRRREDAA